MRIELCGCRLVVQLDFPPPTAWTRFTTLSFCMGLIARSVIIQSSHISTRRHSFHSLQSCGKAYKTVAPDFVLRERLCRNCKKTK